MPASPTFVLREERVIGSLQLTYQAYEHAATGARHLHLASNDRNNVFMVAFPTLPHDSTGVAHVLEHTALCGSQRFPVRDPFFLMLRRSLNTFMNAFTSSDATAYPFATQNDKDFDNLLEVYLDSVFFPLLNELDFAQEGHRLELDEAPGKPPRLQHKGVVFNEMKGAMSAPAAQLWYHLQAHLFPTTTYHHNSGGDPREIPKLTHAALKAFHAAHYHPSHAVFMTYGDRPAADHQARFEACALSRFARAPDHWSVPDEQRYAEPRSIDTRYAADGNGSERHTHVVWGWLLGRSIDVDASLDAHLLTGALLDNSASPLMRYLEETELADAPSELCGLAASSRELTLCCGVEGAPADASSPLEAGLLQVLDGIARDGIPAEVVEGLIDRMEMSQRDVGGNTYPYGLQLMNRLLIPAIHGANPSDFLDIDPALERLRARAADPQHLARLVRSQLLDNPHRVRITMSPQADLAQQERAEEEGRLDNRLKQLSATELDEIRERARRLREWQAREDDPEKLPRVTLADVPAATPVVTGTDWQPGGLRARRYARGTNGIVYQQIITPLPEIDVEAIPLLPYLADFLTDVGCGGADYLEAERVRAAIGGFNANLSVRTDLNDAGVLRGYLAVYGKSLLRKHRQLFAHLHDVHAAARFDEHERLHELISQARAEMEATITDRGHVIALRAASAAMGPSGWLDDQWDGPSSIAALKRLAQDVETASGLSAFAEKLSELAARIRAAAPRLLLVSEAQSAAELAAALTEIWQDAGELGQGIGRLDVTSRRTPSDRAFTTNTQVSFCAQSHCAVPEAHADAAALTVLGRYLQNGFLHQAIRERGGAYGSGAAYMSDACAFAFHSYRDPRVAGTYEDFGASLRWMIDAPSEQLREEAILGVIRGLDQPKSPAGEAIAAYYGELHGRDPDFRKSFRAAVLAVTCDELCRVCEQYLLSAAPVRAVVTSSEGAREAEGLGFTVQAL